VSQVKRNLVANFAGSGWTAVMSLAFIPVYIHFMGIEAYGLIGVFVTLQALTALLDMGLSLTLNREMARLAVLGNTAQKMRDLLRTLEVVFWMVALLVAVTLLASAPFLATSWLRVDSLSVASVEYALVLMGGALALHLPFGLYAGGLLGLQRQVLYNSVVIAATTIRGFGAVLVLWLLSPTITAFFLWQIAASGLQTGVVAIVLWRSLPNSDSRGRFRVEALQSVWRFAAGMSAITVLGVILSQLDKVILSRTLTLEVFGYYTLASVVAMSLYRLITPIFQALYPRLTELAARADADALRRLYHQSAQLLSVLLLPTALVIAGFSYEILLLWTQSEAAATNAWLIMSLLVIGTALNGLMHPPYALQLAHGWTRLALVTNVIAVLLLAPALYLLAGTYGGVGAAAVWVVLNSGYVLGGLQVMHRRLLPDEKWRWYGEDVALPMVAAIAVVGLGRFLLPDQLGQVATVVWIGGVLLAAIAASGMAAPFTRGRTVEMLRTRLSYGV